MGANACAMAYAKWQDCLSALSKAREAEKEAFNSFLKEERKLSRDEIMVLRDLLSNIYKADL